MEKLTIHEILKRLLFDKDMKIIDLARETGLAQQTVQKIVAGNCLRPHKSSLEPIAEFFKISIAQLKGEKPILWENSKNDQLKELGIRKIPLIDWIEIEDWIKKEKISLTENREILITQIPVSSSAFALRIKDESMYPVFPKGSTVIIDPNREYTDRCYVVVKIEQYKEPILRYLILDAGDKFVKPISPDLENFSIHMVKNCDIIYGTLIEAKQVY